MNGLLSQQREAPVPENTMRVIAALRLEVARLEARVRLLEQLLSAMGVKG